MINTTKLDPIETASIDELQALQTARLKWTLNHAYNNVPMYKRKFDAAGVHLTILTSWRTCKIPVHHQAGSARQLPVRYLCGADGAGGAHPRLVGHHRKADRGGIYPE